MMCVELGYPNLGHKMRGSITRAIIIGKTLKSDLTSVAYFVLNSTGVFNPA